MEAGQYAQDFTANLSETEENKVLDELREAGCNIIEVEDKTPWAEACADVISEYSSSQADLYQQILDMK
jgi:TRAP-type C4-dicarboxylate transport system substrate-binding protein